MTTIFYSWQKDLPAKTNRTLIQDALEDAVKAIRADTSLGVEPVVDRDTMGVAGSPDIGSTIFAKIEHAAVFVCDVSIINPSCREHGTRLTPNPNVLIELGFALRTLGWERVVLVLNDAFGPVEALPFDLRQKRALVYECAAEIADRAAPRKLLTKQLETALRLILAKQPSTQPSQPEDVAVDAVSKSSPAAAARVRDYMKALLAELDEKQPRPAPMQTEDDVLVEALAPTVTIVGQFARLAAAIADHGDREAARALVQGFAGFLRWYDTFWYETSAGKNGAQNDVARDFFRFLGHELFVTFVGRMMRADRWDLLADVLAEPLCVGAQNRSIYDLAAIVVLLRARRDRLKISGVELHADLLKERHSSQALAQLAPFEEIVEADYLLLFRSELSGEQSAFASGNACWCGWTLIHTHGEPPRFMVRAQGRSFAGKILGVLGLSDVATFRQRYGERGRAAKGLFRQAVIFIPGMIDPETIATK